MAKSTKAPQPPHRAWYRYNPERLIEAAKRDFPKKRWLPEALEQCFMAYDNTCCSSRICGIKFVDTWRAKRKGSEWQFQGTVWLRVTRHTSAMLAQLKNHGIGGLELERSWPNEVAWLQCGEGGLETGVAHRHWVLKEPAWFDYDPWPLVGAVNQQYPLDYQLISALRETRRAYNATCCAPRVCGLYFVAPTDCELPVRRSVTVKTPQGWILLDILNDGRVFSLEWI